MAFLLRLCLFWVKIIYGNAGVWLVQKIEFSGNWFPLTEKKRLWLRKWISVPIFTSNEFRREREREHEREKHARTSPHRSHAPSSNPLRSQAPAPSIVISRRQSRSRLCADRDLAKRRGASRDYDRWCGRRTGAREAPCRRT